jgi:tetratricopeptide (TPR) repeat protein
VSIDPYSPCPGGGDKKIKFCCPDLVGDLEQIDRLIEGDQVAAALEQTKRLCDKHPGKACLLATRTKLELASREYGAAAATNQAFLAAHPDNPLALGQAAVVDAVAGNIQEAAQRFDRAREQCGAEVSPEFTRIAATLVQAGAQSGHVGFAQGIVEWLIDSNLGSDEEHRLLAAIVGSAGVPPALRTKVLYSVPTGDHPWRPDFEAALMHAEAWRLSKALTLFRSLKSVASTSPGVFINIAVLCEMLARPFEASEAWLNVAQRRADSPDDAIEATGRAIALETEADPDRSPLVLFAQARAPLPLEGANALDLLEDKLRHDKHCEPAPFNRSEWVQRGAAPPHSLWRIYQGPIDGEAPVRLLASLLLFGRQTDKEPEAILQGFAPDVAQAIPIAETLIGAKLAMDEPQEGLPVAAPTSWLLGAQFRSRIPEEPKAPPAAGAPSAVDAYLETQRAAVRERFISEWPQTALPELLGKTPREALLQAEGRLRVEALVSEGEATARRPDMNEAWSTIRANLGLSSAATIDSPRPLEEVAPLRWHRLALQKVDLDQLRGLLVTSIDAGFELAAERAAKEILSRSDAMPADKWQSYGFLEQRATLTNEKLSIIALLRPLAAELKANDGMLDVAELRIRLQRGDQAEIVRLLEHLRNHHARDQQVLGALAEVLMEAGVDLSALAGGPGMRPGQPAAMGGIPGAASAAGVPPVEAGKIWTPGGEQGGGSGEKKIWTPD